MKKKIIASILMIVILFNLTGCSEAKTEKTRYQAEFLELFNTVSKIIGYADTKEDFSEFAQLIYDNLKEYHELYDIYYDYEGINNIKTINDNAGIKPVKVDQRIIDLLNFAKEAYDLSKGEVNVAYGAVLKVWHDYRTEGIDDPDNAQVPPIDLLKEKANHTDINQVIINEEESTVFLEDPEMALDVGAVAKGYATEMVCELAEEKGYTNGLVSIGGNVRAIGNREGEPWNVGIQNPDLESENTNLYILNIEDCSLVSSGDYERFYVVNGKRYHHIIDPKTLMPSDYFRAVSIITKNSGLADALSTCIFNMPYEEGLEIIEKLPDTEALWVLKDGSMEYSSHFKDYIKFEE
ncbi:MAG: rane-associated lipoprotein involved in thiamine biosynthesis [Herbinix sp.]|nr:rane-associated lipoprotein involved in thiamine biosynthesis [Herbinix sp.]